jgi:ABC-type Fe3+/spermidine/putrescine transport system ATPase subunit
MEGRVSDGGVEIRGQRFAVDLSRTGLHDGDRAECTIRPEGMQILDVSTALPTPFAGTVTRCTFLGSIVEYEVSLEGLPVLLAQTPNPLGGRIHGVGSSVGVDFIPGALHVLVS